MGKLKVFADEPFVYMLTQVVFCVARTGNDPAEPALSHRLGS